MIAEPKRNKMLRILSEKKKRHFTKPAMEKPYLYFGEQKKKDGKMFISPENYVRVQKPFDASSINQIEMVKLDKNSTRRNRFYLLFLRVF